MRSDLKPNAKDDLLGHHETKDFIFARYHELLFAMFEVVLAYQFESEKQYEAIVRSQPNILEEMGYKAWTKLWIRLEMSSDIKKHVVS